MENTHTQAPAVAKTAELSVAEKEKNRLIVASGQLGYTPEQVQLLMRTVAKNATVDEFLMFANVCKTSGLNPLQKEIWFYKDNKGNCIITAARDGFLSIAQKSGEFAGLESAAIFSNDEFSIDHSKHEVHHIYKIKDRGELVGAWAKTYRKGCVPNITVVDNATYNKGWNTWKTHPQQMLIKCAEAISLKKTYGISGIVSMEEVGFEPQSTEVNVNNEAAFDKLYSTIKDRDDKADKAKIILNNPPFELTDDQKAKLEAL